MIIELEADGVHFYCSSLEVTRRLVERGARIVGQSQAEEGLRRNVQAEPPPADLESPRS